MPRHQPTPAGVPTRAELAAVIAGAMSETATADELAGAALALVLERHRRESAERKRRTRAAKRGGARRAA